MYNTMSVLQKYPVLEMERIIYKRVAGSCCAHNNKNSSRKRKKR